MPLARVGHAVAFIRSSTPSASVPAPSWTAPPPPHLQPDALDGPADDAQVALYCKSVQLDRSVQEQYDVALLKTLQNTAEEVVLIDSNSLLRSLKISSRDLA